MAFDNFIKNLHNSKSFSNCYEKAKSCEHFTVTGLSESSASLFIAGLTSNHSDQIIVITSDPKSSEHLRSDLEVIGESEVHLFPSYRGLHLQEKQINTDIKLARLKSLQELSTGSPGIYIIEVRALLNDIVSPEVFKNRSITLKTGEDNDFELLVEYLVEEGFQRESMVEDFGDMSVRGGIIDIFPPNYYEPVRVEFFGNTIESIRIFDINDQRSIRTIDSAVIVPPTIDISEDTMPDFTSADSSILTYFSNSATLFFHHPFQAQRTLKEYYDGLKHDKELQNTAELPDDAVVFKNIENYFESRSAAYIRSDITTGNGKNVVRFDFKTLPQFNRSLNLFSKVFNDYHADYPDLTVAVLCDNEGQSDRLKEIILDDDLLSSAYFVRTGSLSSGFVYPEARLALVNDHEIFSRKHTVKPKKLYGARKVLFDDLALRIGDYVVHEDHGIGKYLGLKKISIGQSEQEALKISYRDNDILYLNLEKLPNLEKYTGREGYKPELSKLGGVDWEKIKRKTRKSVKDIAKDLITLYAKRTSQKGYSFGADTQWQREMEASFEYEETPDQLKACWEVKKDMESPKPMDRLVCGDVGFGKTEVALRVAFKAVNDNKQTAILVPTTILAQQHFETFRERLKLYPVNIEMLSRFRTPKEQKVIVAGLADGTVDIVIGTHRLLSKDVSFKNLGLIIIDEEQRFGVSSKEKLKKLRTEVDVLTLTATPIPRTMHMSILGVRDLSVINTPPKNRLPIITEIVQYDDDLIRAAITKELDRGGQIYFVHNRVQTIAKIKKKLEKLVPEAVFEIAHGQMKERDLEKVMLSFLKGEFSCLISTMIIESGLDISNVNTIIVNQADNFGLSQLYQLRGRVGRSDVQAFAYLLTPPFATMTEDSIKRLQTLSENIELGSGFQIALKDLEIRGTGNLLGVEQSGHINAVGFDMYTRLIKNSVHDQMKEIVPESEPAQNNNTEISNIKVDTDIAAFLPSEYIPDGFQRVSFYRRISVINSYESLQEIKNDLTDRYGPLPSAAENLLRIIKIKIIASKLAMDRIKVIRDTFTGTFTVDSLASVSDKEHLAQILSSFVDKSPYPFRLKQEKRLNLELPLKNGSDSENLNYIQDFLTSLQETTTV